MVDFQSRDARRGVADGAGEDDETADAPDEEAEEGTGAHGDHEHAHDHHAHDDHDHHAHDDHDHHAHDEHAHDHHAHDVAAVGAAVVTVSTSRSVEDDPAGDAIVAALEEAGHEVAVRELVNDDFDGIQRTVDALAGRDDVDLVVTTGGTGVSPDDVTVEAVEPLLEKRLPGFGELFRRLSHDEVGTRVVGTRATAGVADGVAVFCLPGSENAARLGASEIIAPEAGHLAGLARRGREE